MIYSYSISAFYEYKKMGHQGKSGNAKNEIIEFGAFNLIISLYAFSKVPFPTFDYLIIVNYLS